MKLIIENLEPEVSEWLLLEYKHSSIIWKGDVIFTNVKPKDAPKFEGLGKVERRRFYEVADNLIILDPRARKILEPKDFQNRDYIVIGGILGDEVPQGRTEKLVSEVARERCSAIFRNLGKVQLPIDQAALVARLIMNGKRFEEIEIQNGVEIILEERKDYIHSIQLPYGYVRIGGKIKFAPGFVEFIKKQGWNI